MAGKLTAQGTGILLVTANVGSLFEDVSLLVRCVDDPPGVRWFRVRDVNVEPGLSLLLQCCCCCCRVLDVS